MAFGIRSCGNLVGTNGNDNAFYLPNGASVQTLTTLGPEASAFGINDAGTIVGQFTTRSSMLGLFLPINARVALVRINAPSGLDTVNAQGINNNGLIVGFHLGTDGQDHGLLGLISHAVGGQLTGTAIDDPTIPSDPGDPGAMFVFSQILGINGHGVAVGYYGDSTGSQHGLLYNTNTGPYTFIDHPSEGFNDGVEVTQITGITNSGEIAGFLRR